MERDYYPCSPNPECPYAKKGCLEDTHHSFYPSTDYQTTLEHVFRNLEENKIEVCRRMHDAIHAGPDPAKPSRDEMFEVVDLAVREDRLYLSVGKQKRIYHDRPAG